MIAPGLRAALLATAARAQDLCGSLVLRGKQATGLLRPLRSRPYLGHGTPDVVYVKGRVRERSGVDEPQPCDTALDNLLATVRRFTATPVPGARVRVRLASVGTATAGTEVQVVSDHDGYFRAELHPVPPLREGWHDLSAELLAPAGGTTTGRVLVPPADAEFGVISDLDDTVLRSAVTEPLQAAATVLLNNATTRTPFHGVAAFYRALRAGPSGGANNPLFYVSSSPWNLYDFVEDFLRVHDIPVGPLFLRAWGLDADAMFSGGHSAHKSQLINGLLATYPDLSFVLIGDSGQQDPEIYRDVVLAWPGRILAVYIRDVTTPERDADVGVIARQVRDTGVAFELVADTPAAAFHAASHRLITSHGLAKVQAAVHHDEPIP